MAHRLLASIFCSASLTMVTPLYAQKDCTVVDSLPYLIAYQGNYCLSGDLISTDSEGVIIDASNVVLDLRGHAITGASNGIGIGVMMMRGATNTTVRNGTIQGYQVGVMSTWNAGGNRAEYLTVLGSSQRGILIVGDFNVIQRNDIHGTEGAGETIAGITVLGLKNALIDNVVVDTAAAGTGSAYGVEVNESTQTRIIGTRVMNTEAGPGGISAGIQIQSSVMTSIEQNAIINTFAEGSIAIAGEDHRQSYCAGNYVGGFSLAIEDCFDGGGNTVR